MGGRVEILQRGHLIERCPLAEWGRCPGPAIFALPEPQRNPSDLNML